MTQTYTEAIPRPIRRRPAPVVERATRRGDGAPASKFADTGRLSAEAVLRRDVLAGLIADPLVSARHIVVAVTEAGEVTLSGHVTSQAQKCAATAAAGRVKGVRSVINTVCIAVPCPAMGDDGTGPAVPPRLAL